MQIIHTPKVYVLGCTLLRQQELQRFLQDHGVPWKPDDTASDNEILVETAGRLCYFSFANPRPGGNAAYINHVISAGHGSVLEHAVWNLLITGVSRSLSHELIRHRVGISPSQLSQRYVDESVAEYVIPDVIRENPELHAIWLQAIETAHEAYCKLADKLLLHLDHIPNRTQRVKAARQAARSVLPNATETKLFLTANARALRHFIELRASSHADAEIRKLANILLDTLQKHSPSLFEDYYRTPLPDGTYEVFTPFRKV